MKDSRTYGQKIGKLFRSLKQKYAKVKKVDFDDPVSAMIYAIVSEGMSLKDTKVAISMF